MKLSRLNLAAGLLYFIVALGLFWCVYRAFLNIEIATNEGWNANFDDAAMGRMPLYPSRDQLITNNYPPLSFYVVGAFGKLIGDTILAGRLLALLAEVVIGIAAACSIRYLGGSKAAAGIGAVYFIGTISICLVRRSGINDPQFLAHAVMTFGFLGFLDAIKRDRGYLPPILTMVVAGFIKHNIVAFPIAGFAWLALERPRRLLQCAAVGGIAAAAGFALCFAAYGHDFFSNLLCPRADSLAQGIMGMKELKASALGLLVWLYVGWTRRGVPAVKLCNILVAISLVTFFLEKCGDGVAENAQFDLVIALSVAMGVAYTETPLLPLARRFAPASLQMAFLLALCIRFAISGHHESIRLITDAGFRNEIAVREKAMADSVARIRAIHGDVYGDLVACYRSGKPFVVDTFTTGQRIKTGQLSMDYVQKRLNNGTLTYVVTDPYLDWRVPFDAKRAQGNE